MSEIENNEIVEAEGLGSNDEFVEILANISGPEGFIKLILDTENEVKRAEGKISAHEKQIASLNRTISETSGSLQALKKMLGIFKHLHQKWGLDKISLAHSMTLIANEKGESESRQVEESLQLMDEDTRKRKLQGKFCMFKDRKTKKWCERILKGDKAKETGYCKAHREALYGEDE